MKALVLAGGLPQIELIKELKRRGYTTILADYYPNPVAKEYADVFYQESTLDVEAIKRIAINEKVKFIITCCTDQAVLTMAKISEELKLPCYIGADIGQWVTNKAYMKEIFQKNCIPTAAFQIVENASEISNPLFPLIVKPVDCNSSKGVKKVNNSEELKIAIQTAVSYSRTRRAIVEEYIEGREVSVDLFVTDGKVEILCTSISDKIKDSSKFVIYRGMCPADISDELYWKIQNAAQKIATAFRLQNCPMLMQLLIKDDDIYVVEFSARTGGCIKYHMIELACGVNVINKTVDLAESIPVEIKPRSTSKTIVNEFIYCRKGIFERLEGFDRCVQQGLLENVFLLKKPGEIMQGVESSGDRIAAITYVADSFGDYVKKHNEVVTKIAVLDNSGNDIMRHDLLEAIEK